MKTGRHIIAIIKMESVEIIVAACAAVTFDLFCHTATGAESIAVLALLAIECMILTRHPQRIFQRRLNDYFVVIHYPFSKWRGIYQSPVRKHRILKSGKSTCKSDYHNLTRQMVGMFTPTCFPDGFYRTITHDTVKTRIERWEKSGYLKILACKPVYRKDLKHLQKDCKRCSDAGQCSFRRYVIQPRQFYYIEFQVHNQ